ncbi:MAG: S8 family serine peptidase [Oscillospiraceae bacterium]|nr:S8 family serine peptidase [Oscillospiraceae bacterium]
MLVAVIDSGIMPELLSVGSLKYDMVIEGNGKVRKRKSGEQIHSFHGTIVAGIIKKYAPDTELCSIQIFEDNTMKTIIEALAAALKWCLKMNIPIINLSLGTTDTRDFKKIRKITEKLLRNGQIIVAACNINGEYTLPAMHTGVIAVRTSAELTDNNYTRTDDVDGTSYTASSNHELTLSGDYIVRTQISSSYATPTITAAVVNGQIAAP